MKSSISLPLDLLFYESKIHSISLVCLLQRCEHLSKICTLHVAYTEGAGDEDAYVSKQTPYAEGKGNDDALALNLKSSISSS